MWGAHEGMGWLMLFFMFWSVFLGGLVIYLVFWAGSRVFRDRSPEEAPVEILRRRYARGELSQEEFDRMRRELSYDE